MKTKTRQREFGFVNWGGKRRGAGRKPKGDRACVSHTKRPKVSASHPVLVTLRLCADLPSLRYEAAHTFLRSAMSASSQGEAFRVVEYSVQSNHLHLIIESKGELALARGMNGLASRIARGLNMLWRRSGKVFSDRYHARALETPRAVRIALVYVLNNARKHGAWVARGPDPYSSGRDFDGWRREAGSSEDAQSRPQHLQRARTWLLTVGWRRHGLLDLAESPAREARSKGGARAIARAG